MVENVIEVRSYFKSCRPVETEIFVDSKIYAPSAWANEEVSLGNSGVIEQVSSEGR